MKRHGFAVLSLSIFFLLFTTILLTIAHFMGQRLKGMKRLDAIERRIHKLHRTDFQGKRKFWPTFDKPPPENLKPRLSRRRRSKSHQIAIDFGRTPSVSSQNFHK